MEAARGQGRELNGRDEGGGGGRKEEPGGESFC